MEGLVRRPSGVYVARLVVPKRLRHVIGKSEFLRSTGSKELVIARVVAGGLLASWRNQLLECDRLMIGSEIDVLRALRGSATLALSEYLPLAEAAAAAGLTVDVLLREAAAGKINIFVRLQCWGYRIPRGALKRDQENGRELLIVPTLAQLPTNTFEETFTGVLAVPESTLHAEALLAGHASDVVWLQPVTGGHLFVPADTLRLEEKDVLLHARQVDGVRRRVAALIDPVEIEEARMARSAVSVSASARPRNLRHEEPLAGSIKHFLSDHKKGRAADQVRRIQAACELFLELMGPGLRGSDLDRDLVRRFRDVELPKVPANENKIRLQMGTKSITESIQAVEGTDWRRLSPEEQTKRMHWIAGWLSWLGLDERAERGVADGLAGGGVVGRLATARKRTTTGRDKRDAFTAEELQRIFSADWFRTGAGELTRVGTHRTWMPYRTWLPLIGLLSGARINEIAQLQVGDMRQSLGGVWLFDFADDDSEDGTPKVKKLKNAQSRRAVPIHSTLIRLGLIEWRDRVAAEEHLQLFPELRRDEVKGHGKAATKWFSSYLKSLGMPRNGRKVFHSFRHNVATALENNESISQGIASQILGHLRGTTTTQTTYRKDDEALMPDSPIVKAIESLRYEWLSMLAPLNIDAGIRAVRDALERKQSVRRDS